MSEEKEPLIPASDSAGSNESPPENFPSTPADTSSAKNEIDVTPILEEVPSEQTLEQDSAAAPGILETLKKKKKLLIILVSAIVVLAIAAVIFIKVLIPVIKYNNAEKAYAEGSYETANAIYSELGDYKDSADKAVLAEKASHYKKGTEAFNSGDYVTAESEYDLADDYEDASDRSAESALAHNYTLGVDSYNKGDYENAIMYFAAAKDYQDSHDQKDASYYMLATSQMDNGNYADAAETFSEISSYSDSNDKIFEIGKTLLQAEQYDDAYTVFALYTGDERVAYCTYCTAMKLLSDGDYEAATEKFNETAGIEKTDEMLLNCKMLEAEKYWSDGYLNTAKALYEELPDGFSYNGVSASDRLASIAKHSDFVAICGDWGSSTMNASVRQTHVSTGSWDQWDAEGGECGLFITCVINEDDTVTMTAVAWYLTYTNYSSLSRYCKATYISETFEYTGKSRPSSISNSLSKLSISSNSFKLSREFVDKTSSMNFNYTYKTNATYDSFSKAY